MSALSSRWFDKPVAEAACRCCGAPRNAEYARHYADGLCPECFVQCSDWLVSVPRQGVVKFFDGAANLSAATVDAWLELPWNSEQ